MLGITDEADAEPDRSGGGGASDLLRCLRVAVGPDRYAIVVEGGAGWGEDAVSELCAGERQGFVARNLDRDRVIGHGDWVLRVL